MTIVMLGLMMIWVIVGDAVGVITENHFQRRKNVKDARIRGGRQTFMTQICCIVSASPILGRTAALDCISGQRAEGPNHMVQHTHGKFKMVCGLGTI